MRKAQTADEDIDVPTDVKGLKQAVDSLSASISECAGEILLSEEADVVVAARELEGAMKTKLRATIKNVEQMLREAMSTAETTREWAPLAAYLETLVADEVLRQSCADAVESAENLLATLRAEEKASCLCLSVFIRFYPMTFVAQNSNNRTYSCSLRSTQIHACNHKFIDQIRLEWTWGPALMLTTQHRHFKSRNGQDRRNGQQQW